jgi:AcrR family transcriptional regulator
MSAVPVGEAQREPPVPRRLTARRMTARQQEVFGRIVRAAEDEARERGYEGVTVRGVARRAGAATATAYALFSSKDHMLAEAMWARMAAHLAHPVARGGSRSDRVVRELEYLGTFLSDDPALAEAGTIALLGPGPDVREVRVRLGTAAHERLMSALGEGAAPDLVLSLDLIYSGALLWRGFGHLPAGVVPSTLATAARRLLGGTK